MTKRKPNSIRTRALIMVTAAILSVVLIAPAAGQNIVTLTITGSGPLSAVMTVESPFRQIRRADAAQRETAFLLLLISDARGTSAGWSVSLCSTDFTSTGKTSKGRGLSNQGFSVFATGAPIVVAGEPLGKGGPKYDPGAGVSLAQMRRVVWAEAGSGSGDYAQWFGVSLVVPAGSRSGPYVATLTVAITAGP